LVEGYTYEFYVAKKHPHFICQFLKMVASLGKETSIRTKQKNILSRGATSPIYDSAARASGANREFKSKVVSYASSKWNSGKIDKYLAKRGNFDVVYSCKLSMGENLP
jgi:hypothetical protein